MKDGYLMTIMLTIIPLLSCYPFMHHTPYYGHPNGYADHHMNSEYDQMNCQGMMGYPFRMAHSSKMNDKISREEWAEYFQMMDTDKDGFVTEKEWCDFANEKRRK